MPKDTDEIEDLPSSEQATGDDQVQNLADDAASPTAADETPKDTLAVVRDVIAAGQETPEEPGSSPEGEDGAAEVVSTNAPDDTDYTDVPFHKHPRFQRLLQEKKTAEVDATRYRNVEAFLERSGLGSDEAADGLEIMALAKSDPVAAWARIKPWAEKVAVAAGVILPPDLQQKVAGGEMTREVASELSKARAQVQSVETRTQLQQQQQAQRAQQEASQAILGAAQSWEADRQAKDPNFAAKVPVLQREIAYLHQTEGRPTTPQGVKDQLDRAYKAVNAAYRPAQPDPQAARKPAVRPVTGGQVAGAPAAAPSSTLDIIRANRRTG